LPYRLYGAYLSTVVSGLVLNACGDAGEYAAKFGQEIKKAS